MQMALSKLFDVGTDTYVVVFIVSMLDIKAFIANISIFCVRGVNGKLLSFISSLAISTQ